MRMLTRAMKAVLWLLLALCAGVAIGALALRYAIFPHLDIWRVPAQQALGRLLHAQVNIRTLQGQWRGLQPCLTIDTLVVRDLGGRRILEVPHIEAIFSWRTLSKFRLIFSNIRIDAPHVVAYKTADGGVMAGDFLVPASTLTHFLSSSSSNALPLNTPPLAFLEAGLSELHGLFDQKALQINNGRIDLQEPLYADRLYHKAGLFSGHAVRPVEGYYERIQIEAGKISPFIASSLAPSLTLPSIHLPFCIKDIQFAIFNQSRHHQVGMQAQVEGMESTSLMDIRLNFHHRFWSQVTNPAAWVGTGYIHVADVPLRMLTQLLHVPMRVSDGMLSARNWFAFKKGHIRALEGAVNILGAHLSARTHSEKGDLKKSLGSSIASSDLDIAHLSFTYKASHRPALHAMQRPSQRFTGLFAAQIHDLVIELGGSSAAARFASAWMEVTYQTPDRQKSGCLTVKGDVLDLDFLSACVQPFIPRLSKAFMPPEKVIFSSAISGVSEVSKFQNIDVKGVLRNYILDMQYPLPTAVKTPASLTRLPRYFGRVKQKQYRFKADFDNLTVLSHIGAPLGVAHVSGSIDANERSGTLTLNTHEGSVSMPQGLNTPTMAFDVLKGKIEWLLTPVPSGHVLLKLTAAPLLFSNKDGAGEIEASYQKPITLPAPFARLLGQSAQIKPPPSSPRDSLKFSLDSESQRNSVKHAVYDAVLSKGLLDFSMRLDRALLARIPRYLPSSLDKGLRDYLTHALQGGFTKHATLEIHGALEDFPFGSANAAGVFKVQAPFYEGRFDPSAPPSQSVVDNTTTFCTSSGLGVKECRSENGVATAPATENKTTWPALEGLEGIFEIDRDALEISLTQGHYQDIKITKAQGKIAHLSRHTDDMLIDVHASGPLNVMLDYVKRSPIPSWTGHVTDWFAASGPAQLALHLQLPRQGSMRVGVEGAVTFSGNTVSTQIFDLGAKSRATKISQRTPLYVLPDLTQLNGVLEFTEHSLALSSATAQWLGGKVKGEVKVHADGSTSLHAEGLAQAQALRNWLYARKMCKEACIPFMEHLGEVRDASVPYQFALKFPHEASFIGKLQADLAGLALHWPAPFAKSKGQPMHLRMRVENGGLDQNNKSVKNGPSNKPDKRIDIELGPLLAAYRLREMPASNEYKVVSGALRVDAALFLSGTDVKTAFLGRARTLKPPVFAEPWQTLKLPEQGVVASLQTTQLDIDAWRTALNAIPTPLRAELSPSAKVETDFAESAQSMYWPTKLNARVGTVLAAQRAWHAVSLDAAYVHGAWHATTTAREFAGQLSWTPPVATRPNVAAHMSDAGALKAHLLKLEFPPIADIGVVNPLGTSAFHRQSEHKKADLILDQSSKISVKEPFHSIPVKQAELHLKDWPALDVQIDDLDIEGKKLGQLAIVTHSTVKKDNSVWQLEKLQITNPDATFCTKGKWTVDVADLVQVDGKPLENIDLGRSAFDSALDIKNAGALLERLGIPKMLQGGMGSIKSQVQWRGVPEHLSYDSLTGHITVDLNHGQILKAEPGVGNLLGAFSLQSLAHLLVLDFRYFPGRGLAFDHAKGTAVIQNGVAYIDDFIVQSTPAHIKLAGSADLANRQQNLMLTIQPAINASSAVLAATVLNPVLGLGSYIAQQVLSASIAHNFILHYAVSGSWDDPIVKRVQADSSIPIAKTQDHEN